MVFPLLVITIVALAAVFTGTGGSQYGVIGFGLLAFLIVYLLQRIGR